MRGNRMGLVGGVAAAVVAGPALGGPGATPTFDDIQYGDGHLRQTLDIYIPPGTAAAPRPALVWIHGGGWVNGSNAGAAERAPRLMARGFVVVGLNYRYSTDAPFPAQIHDTKGAIRWLRANAAVYNIDPTRIGVWGGSSGGHLAGLAGTSGDTAELEGTVGGNLEQSSRVQAVIDTAGHSDFFEVHAEYAVCFEAESLLFGACLNEIQEHRDDPGWADLVALVEQAGPVTHVSADDPPFWLAHGLADTRVLPIHSQLLHDALVAAGVTSHLALVPDLGHTTGPGWNETATDMLGRWLGNPACPADWNNDGVVNSNDISGFLATWLTSLSVGSPGGDFDESGAADSSDISAYLSAWLEQIGAC